MTRNELWNIMSIIGLIAIITNAILIIIATQIELVIYVLLFIILVKITLFARYAATNTERWQQ